MKVLYVAAGGAVGSALRYLVGVGVLRAFGGLPFPLGTFIVNVLGSVMLGVMLELFATREMLTPGIRLALTTGAMGGFTTYSTFNHEMHRMLTTGQTWAALGYLVATVVVCFLATAAGIALVR